jgi:hypothetical protein
MAQFVGCADFGVGAESQQRFGGAQGAETQLQFDFRGVDYLTVKDGKIAHVISVFDLLPMYKAGSDIQH